MVNRREIIMTMTSTPERLAYGISETLDSVLVDSVLLPDILEITLSIAEFPNKEKDLPDWFLSYLKEHELVKLFWIESDIGTYKKLIPALDRHWGTDAIICTIDDDCKYDKNMLREMVDAFLSAPNCYSTCDSLASFMDLPIPLGRCSVYTPSLFDERVFSWLTEEILELNEDDWYIAFMLFISDKVTSCRICKTPIELLPVGEIKTADYNTMATFQYYSKLLRVLVNRTIDRRE